MKIVIIGRTKSLYDATIKLHQKGHNIVSIITAKAAPEYQVTEADFKGLAQEINADYFYCPKINSTEGVEYLKKLGPIDIGVSVNYVNIISDEVIGYFSHGILNAHGGDLPRYKGNACQAWAILNGEEKIGLCIHKMIGGEVDDGNIIARDYFPLTLSSRIGEVYDWMQKRIPDLFVNAIDNLSKDQNYTLEHQDKRNSLRCYPLRPEDASIDWLLGAEEILRLINSSSEPYQGAYCSYKGEKLIIWRASLWLDEEQYLSKPGQICMVSESNVVVATGNGKILLQEVEINEERSMPSRVIKSIRDRLK